MATKNPHLKKANEQHEYTTEQITELRKCSTDPIYFINEYCQIQTATQGAARFLLRDYQKRLLGTIHDNRLSVVLAPRQIGKALGLDTQIPTPTGWTTMGDIQVGEYVLGANGLPTQVIAATDVLIDRPCYVVELSTGEKITADANHKWLVTKIKSRYGPAKEIVVTTEELSNLRLSWTGVDRKYKTMNYSIPVCSSLQLPAMVYELDPYMLGVWLGDGTSSAPNITNHIKDVQIIHECERLGYETKYYKLQNTDTYRVYFKGLRQQLNSIGVLNNKHIPIEYLRGSYAQRLELLKGLMDTDGTIGKNGICEFTLAHEVLANQTRELVCSLGLKPSPLVTRRVGRFVRYTITFKPFSDNIQVFKLQRKLDRMQQSPDPIRVASTTKREIVSVTKTTSVPVRCIQVDSPDSLFLVTKSLIPTHNSWIAGGYLLWYANFHFDQTVVIASNKNDNAMEMIHRVRFIYERLPHWLKAGVSADGWNKHEMGFDNGSRIISQATSENTGRGLSISLLFLDEFAFVRDSIAEEFWTSISPTLATGGKCIICSTPNGDTNRFAQIWRGANIPSVDDPTVGVNGYAPIEIAWNDPPGRDGVFKAAEIAKIGETRWRQEYQCCTADTLIDVQDATGNIQTIALGELYTQLKAHETIIH